MILFPTSQREHKPFSKVDREAEGDHAPGLLLFPTCWGGALIFFHRTMEARGLAPARGSVWIMDGLAGALYWPFMGKIDEAGEYPRPVFRYAGKTSDRSITQSSRAFTFILSPTVPNSFTE